MKPQPSLTADALAALGSAGFSRRRFLKGSGALIVGFSAAATVADTLGWAPRSASAQGINGAGSNQLDSWIAIAADGRVTAYTGKCELGHGLYTAQMQLIAEELSVPFSRVTLIQCDTALTPDQGTTSGAQSHPTNFNQSNLALAGATARETLVQLAATRLAVSADQLVVKDGVISARNDASKQVAYGELVGGRTFNIPLNTSARRKDPREWTVLGKPVQRVDIPAMATGQFEYVHDVRVPGMLHGRVVRPPAAGATLVGVDEDSVKDVAGVVKVVVRNNFVGIVAEKPWQAIQAAAKLKATWTAGTGLPRPGTVSTSTCGPGSRHGTRWPSIRRTSTRNCRRRRESSRPRITIRIRCTHRSAARAPSPMFRATRRRSGRPPRRCILSGAPPRWCSASSPRTCA